MAKSAPQQAVIRGRGARSNDSSRFLDQSREAFEDGWDEADALPAQLPTTLQPMQSRTVITRNKSPDIGFDRSINPYRGCEHGCTYCFARPAHAYLGLSPGLDFETRLFYKADAGERLARELSRKGYRPALIQLGADTDPYQPIERRLLVTRALLETLERFGHPVAITTKSDLILRDVDLLARLAGRNLVRVAISVTSLDRQLSRSMEPRAVTPARRLATIEGLAKQGVPVKVLFAPAIPGLNDHEMESVLKAASDHGAMAAGYIVLRLPREVSFLFEEWLKQDWPDRASRVMSLVRQMRNGLAYDSSFGTRMVGQGPVAQMLAQRFGVARRRLGLDWPSPPPSLEHFKVPAQSENGQTDLFS